MIDAPAGAVIPEGLLVRLERRSVFRRRKLDEHWGRMTPEGVRLDLRVTHQDPADVVGAARGTVTDAFGRLQERGEIEMRQRTVITRQADDQSLTATEIA